VCQLTKEYERRNRTVLISHTRGRRMSTPQLITINQRIKSSQHVLITVDNQLWFSMILLL
jgi:hypothetical protein